MAKLNASDSVRAAANAAVGYFYIDILSFYFSD